METYKIREFLDSLVSLEEYLIFLAANDGLSEGWGIRRALMHKDAEVAISVMRDFSGNLAEIKRAMAKFDKDTLVELQSVENSANLSQQIGLIALQLRMESVRFRQVKARSFTSVVLAAMPYISAAVQPRKSPVVAAQISLEKTIIGLQQVEVIVSAVYGELTKINFGDNELFQPSKIDSNEIIRIIEEAVNIIDALPGLAEDQKEIIRSYANEAKREFISKHVSWTRVVGALVVIAAIIGGIADAKEAAENIREAVRYIVESSSVQKEKPGLVKVDPKEGVRESVRLIELDGP